MLNAKSNPNEVYAELERVHGRPLYYNHLYPLKVKLGGSLEIDVMVSLKRGGGRSAGKKVILYLPFFQRAVDPDGVVREVFAAWKTQTGKVLGNTSRNAVDTWKSGGVVIVDDDREKEKLIFKNLKKMGIKIPEIS